MNLLAPLARILAAPIRAQLQVVTAAGGLIDASSAVGEGTTFTIRLPAVPAPATPDVLDARDASPGRGGTERILVVEDDDAVRRLAVRGLSSAGYVVLQAANGADAVRVAAELDAPIDLVLSDVVMPGVRDATAVADVRRNHPKARALFMTGYADARSLADLRDPLLQKPFTPRELLERVREVLDSTASPFDGS